jgi:hypothetical protein
MSCQVFNPEMDSGVNVDLVSVHSDTERLWLLKSSRKSASGVEMI